MKKHDVVKERWNLDDLGESAKHLTFKHVYVRICRDVCPMGNLMPWM